MLYITEMDEVVYDRSQDTLKDPVRNCCRLEGPGRSWLGAKQVERWGAGENGNFAGKAKDMDGDKVIP